MKLKLQTHSIELPTKPADLAHFKQAVASFLAIAPADFDSLTCRYKDDVGDVIQLRDEEDYEFCLSNSPSHLIEVTIAATDPALQGRILEGFERRAAQAETLAEQRKAAEASHNLLSELHDLTLQGSGLPAAEPAALQPAACAPEKGQPNFKKANCPNNLLEINHENKDMLDVSGIDPLKSNLDLLHDFENCTKQKQSGQVTLESLQKILEMVQAQNAIIASLGKNVKDLHALVDSKNKEIDEIKQQLRDLTQPGLADGRPFSCHSCKKQIDGELLFQSSKIAGLRFCIACVTKRAVQDLETASLKPGEKSGGAEERDTPQARREYGLQKAGTKYHPSLIDSFIKKFQHLDLASFKKQMDNMFG